MVFTNTLVAFTSVLALAAAAPAKVARSSAPFGNKKGVSYNQGSGAKAQVLSRNNGPTWSYNWSPAEQAPAFEQVPMCWNTGCDLNAITNDLNSVSTEHRYVLGYNEPDRADQAHLSPGQAYDAWGNQFFRFANAGAKLICPAITSYDATVGGASAGGTNYASGFTWLRQFLNHDGRNDPGQFRCFAQAIHWYGGGGSPQDQANAFISYVQNAHNQINSMYGRDMPLWITEFAPADGSYNPADVSDSDRAAFLNAVQPWLNSQEYVDRYAFFDVDYLVNGNSLTQAGNAYVSH